MSAHWQPKSRKEDEAQDIRDFVQRDDPAAEMKSLIKMSAVDLCALMLAIRRFDEGAGKP